MTTPHRTGMTIHFSKPMLVGMALLLTLPWVGVGLLASNQRATSAASLGSSAATAPSAVRPVVADPASTADPLAKPEVFESKPGPWGQMQCVPIVLEVPDDYIFLNSVDAEKERWAFSGMNKDAALALVRSCGLTTEQIESLSRSPWSEAGDTSAVTPSDELILALTPEARASLYNTLSLDRANAELIDPFWFRPGRVEFRLRGANLSSESVALLKRLLYPSRDGQAMLFADVRPALRSISDPAERRRFFKAVSRKRSLMARLMITAESDVQAIANYWGADGRQKDLVPMLNSLKYNVEAGIETPSMINVLALLPSFARERLYNHAYATQSMSGRKEDCFWTAFNFFNQYPDNAINDMSYLSKVLERDYYKVSEPTKLGDVILIIDDSGEAIHAANYIADDIVFTKNGVNFTQPWILVTMSDMLETYKIKSNKIEVACFRRKGT